MLALIDVTMNAVLRTGQIVASPESLASNGSMEARRSTNRWEQERSNIDEQPWKYKLSVGLLSSETVSGELLIVYRQSSELFSWILFLMWKTTGAVPRLRQMTGRHWLIQRWTTQQHIVLDVNNSTGFSFPQKWDGNMSLSNSGWTTSDQQELES